MAADERISMNKKTKWSLMQMCLKYVVEAKNLQEFCDKYHRQTEHDKWYMDDEYMEKLRNEVQKDGCTFFPKGSTVTGDHCAFIPGISDDSRRFMQQMKNNAK
jgi:hypothetical protein